MLRTKGWVVTTSEGNKTIPHTKAFSHDNDVYLAMTAKKSRTNIEGRFNLRNYGKIFKMISRLLSGGVLPNTTRKTRFFCN